MASERTTSGYSRAGRRSLAEDKPAARRLAANLETLRKARGMTWAGLSDAMRAAGQPIPIIGLRRIRDVKRRVDLDELLALARVLGATTDLLIAEKLCEVCSGTPPVGFSCLACDATGGLE